MLVRSWGMGTALVLMVFGLVGCGGSPASAPPPRAATSAVTPPALARAARAVSFTPTLPSTLPPGYAFRSVQINAPPPSVANPKRSTMLILTFVGHGERFQLTETALKTTLGGATRGPMVDGVALSVTQQTNGAVHVISALLRIHGVTYILTSPGSLTMSQVQEVMASLAG